MNFGDVLRCLIEKHRLTQKQVSVELNIAPSTLGNYIRNIREPDIYTLKSLASYFHVSIDYLLDYQQNVPIINADNNMEILQIYNSLGNVCKKIYIEQGKILIKYDNCFINNAKL